MVVVVLFPISVFIFFSFLLLFLLLCVVFLFSLFFEYLVIFLLMFYLISTTNRKRKSHDFYGIVAGEMFSIFFHWLLPLLPHLTPHSQWVFHCIGDDGDGPLHFYCENSWAFHCTIVYILMTLSRKACRLFTCFDFSSNTPPLLSPHFIRSPPPLSKDCRRFTSITLRKKVNDESWNKKGILMIFSLLWLQI